MRLATVLTLALVAGCSDRGAPSMSNPLWPARTVSISIDRPPAAVYEFAANPENLPMWASGLAGSIKRRPDGSWAATSPMGEVVVRFAGKNALGVLDHDVTLPSGETVHNPMRVVPNASGSELTFTLFKRPGVTDTDFERDASTVTRDLATLKGIVERGP